MLTLILERMFTTPKMISARPDVDKASGLFLYSPLRWGLLGWASLKSCDGLLLLTLETVLGMMTSKKKKEECLTCFTSVYKKGLDSFSGSCL